MSIIPHKRCTKCGTEKPLTDFSKLSASRDGHHPRCRACRSQDGADYRQKDPGKYRAMARASAAKHAEHHRVHGRAYYQANREHVLERTTRYRKEHPEVGRKADKNFREKHRERRLPDIRRRSAEWRAQNRERDREASKRWRNNNRVAYRAIQHRRKTRKAGNGGSYTAQEWEALKARYHYRCLRCGKQEPEIELTVDHVVPVALGGTSNIENLQPLCKPCNCSKQDDATDYR